MLRKGLWNFLANINWLFFIVLDSWFLLSYYFYTQKWVENIRPFHHVYTLNNNSVLVTFSDHILLYELLIKVIWKTYQNTLNILHIVLHIISSLSSNNISSNHKLHSTKIWIWHILHGVYILTFTVTHIVRSVSTLITLNWS